MRMVSRGFLMACVASGLIAADVPYAGKWKMNPGKSDFGGSIVTYEVGPGGQMKITMDGMSYSVKADGAEYPTPWGMTTAWKTVDANTWAVTNSVNGKVMENAIVKLSPDGASLTVDSKLQQSSGGPSNNVTVYSRVSGGRGLAGQWKTKNLKMSIPGLLQLVPKPGGVTIRYVNEGAACDALFDGKDYPATGGMFPPGWTCKVSEATKDEIDVTWKKDGRAVYMTNLIVSGKTMTELTAATASSDKVKIIYDKQ